MSAKIIVIGGANADLYGQIAVEQEAPADSNPGHISIHAGGVGRNIAENLAHLGAEIEFIGHFGGDDFAMMLERSLTSSGASISLSMRTPRSDSDLYLAIHNKQGELISAVNNMGLVERLPKNFFNAHTIANAITTADLIILDGNLSEEVLDDFFQIYGNNSVIAVDSVSTVKARRFISHLSKIDYLKCNLAEARILVSAGNNLSLDSIKSIESVEEISQRLMKTGVGTALISNSDAGFIVANGGEFKHFSAPKLAKSYSSGAGDALFSGFLYAISRGENSYQASLFALKAAETALRFNGPVNPEIATLGKI
ncbi:MAG: PfkB family carbohydrate kinase [Alphaproteobacteria bacterium]